MNGIIQGKQEKQAGSLVWQTLLTASADGYGISIKNVSSSIRNDRKYFVRVLYKDDVISRITNILLVSTSGDNVLTSPYLYYYWYTINSQYTLFLTRSPNDSSTIVSDYISSMEIGYFE